MVRKVQRQRMHKRFIVKRKESVTFLLAFAVYCRSEAEETILRTFFNVKVQKDASVTYMEWKEALRARYVNTDPEVIADIIEGAGAFRTSAVNRQATKWLREYNLYTWVLQQNQEQGIAPSYKSLFRKRAALETNELVAEPLAASSMRRKGTRWKTVSTNVWVGGWWLAS